MSKRWSNIILNGMPFEHDTKGTCLDTRIGKYGDITEAYIKPSWRKINIYVSWWNWFNEHGGNCGVSSKNCNFFSICGYVRDENGKLWQCYITPSHNYCYEVIGG